MIRETRYFVKKLLNKFGSSDLFISILATQCINLTLSWESLSSYEVARFLKSREQAKECNNFGETEVVVELNFRACLFVSTLSNFCFVPDLILRLCFRLGCKCETTGGLNFFHIPKGQILT